MQNELQPEDQMIAFTLLVFTYLCEIRCLLRITLFVLSFSLVVRLGLKFPSQLAQSQLLLVSFLSLYFLVQ